MSNNQTSFKNTVKNTSIFGGVQLINVFINILKGKFISMFLGSYGMGVNGLLQSPINLIKTITGLGLSLSAVRNLSEAVGEGNENSLEVKRTVTIIRKLFILTGIFGGLVTFIFAPQLSSWSFGNSDYNWSFRWLSISILLMSINEGQNTLLRGLRYIPSIVKSSVIGSVLGLFTSIPLYYFYGVNGIVPALIISALIATSLSWFFTRKIKSSQQKLTYSGIYDESLDMIKMGLMLVIAIFVGSLTKFIINLFIGRIGSINDVGLYNAAISISSQYIGFILTSLSVDYFPRLAAVNKFVDKTNKIVNEQIEVVVLLATPLLIFMILTAPLMIKIMLTSEFLVVTDFIRFVAIGSFFQVTSFSIGYISFAKNDKYFYLLLEGGLSNLLQLVCSLTAYYYWGLNGLGYSFIVIYFSYLILVLFFTKQRYQFLLFNNTRKKIIVSFIFLLSSLLITTLLTATQSVLIGCLILVTSIYYTYRQLESQMGISLKNIFKRK